MSRSDNHVVGGEVTISGNATRIQRCREKKAALGLERIEITLGSDLVDRLREEAQFQQVPLPRMIEAVLRAHIHSGKRVWV